MPNITQPDYVVLCQVLPDGSYEPVTGQAVNGGGSATPSGGAGFSAGADFMPTAADYGAGDIIGAPQEFIFTDRLGGQLPPASLITITTSVIRINVPIVPSGQTNYVLQMYSAMSASPQADNDVWSLNRAELMSYMGSIDLGSPVDLGGALYVKTGNLNFDMRLTGISVFARLVTVGAFTSAGVARNVRLHGIVR
jgi:hypothetical protein